MPLLTEAQRKLVAAALSVAAAAAILAIICGSVVVLGRILALFAGALWPVAVSGILALILRPCVDFLEARTRLGRLSAVLVLFTAFLLLGGLVAMLVLPSLITQLVDFVAYLPVFYKNAIAYINNHAPAWTATVRSYLDNPLLSQLAESLALEAKELLTNTLPTLKSAGGGILSLFSGATQLATVPIYLFFFLLSKADPTSRLGDHMPFIKPGLRDDLVFLAGEFVSIIVSFFRGQLLIGLIMGCMLSVGFSIVGLKFGLFLGLLIGLLNIVPYLGTILGILITLPLAFLQTGGGWKLLGLVILVKLVVQNVEGWFLTPKIMGDRTGLHPAAIIFALFFWGAALDGILGMVLAIPLTAFFVTAWRLAKRKYFASHATS